MYTKEDMNPDKLQRKHTFIAMLSIFCNTSKGELYYHVTGEAICMRCEAVLYMRQPQDVPKCCRIQERSAVILLSLHSGSRTHSIWFWTHCFRQLEVCGPTVFLNFPSEYMFIDPLIAAWNTFYLGHASPTDP